MALPSFAHLDLGNAVIKQHWLWNDSLLPNFSFGSTRKLVVEKQLSSMNGVFVVSSCPLSKVGDTVAAPSAGSFTKEGITQKERQELLWKDFFLYPKDWWDTRQHKQSSRSPDFRHKKSKEALWLDNRFKPGWVDPQLALWDARIREPLDTAEMDSNVESLIERCDQGQLIEAVEALDLQVQRGSFVPFTLFYRVLKRCMAQEDLVLGKRVHALTVKSGYEGNEFLANHIICMYACHGRLQEARQVFTKVPMPDAHMWTSMILAEGKHGQPTEAVKLYREMQGSTVKPDNHIYVAVLNACASSGDLASGKEVHADIEGSTDKPNVFVGNCLVDMYAKCGSLVDARKVFDNMQIRDVVTWNAMISGYTQHGLGQEALTLYACMRKEERTPANHFTFACLLQACASIGALRQGKQLHAEIVKNGLQADLVVGNSLVNMYAKCGSLGEARTVFDLLLTKDVVTWNAMIGGYAQNGLGHEALSLYASMEQEEADAVTFVCLLKACATVGAMHQGMQLEAHILDQGMEADIVVGNSLVDMYARCGSLDNARRVFDILLTKDVVTWTALLNGYAHQGDSKLAIECFKQMQEQGVEPSDATFTCLLVACSHQGLVTEGKSYFRTMVEDHGIAPNAHHYSCMVDLLGRSGLLDEAEDMLQIMPFENNVVAWTSLLSACKSHGDVERGERCFEHLVKMEPKDAGTYVLLKNIYANVSRWKDVDRIESLRKSAGAWKKPAQACIEVQNKVHEFIVGEERYDISSKLRSFNLRLKEGGHVPHTELVLKPMSEPAKEDALCGHAEKLALAYGLLNTPDGTTLLVTKNLRMCDDCHSSTKIMSRLERRDIIVRDAHRVHQFVDGSCSCGDRH